MTPLGALSGVLQANYALLVGPDGGELVQTPRLPVEANSIQRTATMTLDATGTLRGDIHEVWSGDMASLQSAQAQGATRDTDVIRPVERVVAGSFSTYDIVKATMGNSRVNDRPFEWRYTLEARNYAKSAGDLLLVRPRVIGIKASGLLETQEPPALSDRIRGRRA
jgi:hypothetical protein